MELIVNEPLDDSGHVEPGHPERPDRLVAVRAAIDDLKLGSDLVVAPDYVANHDDLARVHDGQYLQQLEMFCRNGGGDLDPDTYATFDSWSIATRAAGSGLAVVEELRRRESGVGFVAVRPPGHHALIGRAMGFCLLNNVAVAAAALVDKGERVLIVDWDVHHGNGTQEIFWDDPRVLYVSAHQTPLYPGTGRASEVGGPSSIGGTLNVPVPRGATGDVLLFALAEVATPVIVDFAPTWVLVSSGFDAHRSDPLAELQLTSGDYAELALALAVAAVPVRAGRVALFLEGGYDLRALRSSVRVMLTALLGGRDDDEPPSVGGPGLEDVRRAAIEREVAITAAQHVLDGENS
jgi:acetoin utilization deacetylase AcuC-like enzyme